MNSVNVCKPRPLQRCRDPMAGPGAESDEDPFSRDESPLPLPHGQVVEEGKDTVNPPEAKRGKLCPTQPSRPSQADGELEVEIVQVQELDFLDGVTRLALLESEFEDARRGLMLHRSLEQYIPFKLYRHWGHRVMSVTDITGGMWCEVQLEYRHIHPHLKNSKEWTKMKEKGSPVVLKTETMKKGSAVHMKKELEVHEVVNIPSVTKEDRMAIQLVTTYSQLAIVKTGKIERELAVFGDPFGLGVLVRGVIDQLQYSLESGELILTDNKTRRSKSMPLSEQRRGTSIQLMLYKYLLDHMCLGTTQPSLLYNHLHLDPDSCLTQGPTNYIDSCGLNSLFSDGSVSNSSEKFPEVKFGALVDRILQLIAGLGLPLVSSLIVQYEHQESGEILGVDTVQYDEQWMKAEVQRSLEFWDGTRPSQGADIEDSAWKCGRCQFRDVCKWRLKRELETSPAAKLLSP